jgi:hypothetical protein
LADFTFSTAKNHAFDTFRPAQVLGIFVTQNNWMGFTVGGAVPIACETFSKAGVVVVAGEAVPVADVVISIAYIAVPVAQERAIPVADRALFLFLMELSLHRGSCIMFLNIICKNSKLFILSKS